MLVTCSCWAAMAAASSSAKGTVRHSTGPAARAAGECREESPHGLSEPSPVSVQWPLGWPPCLMSPSQSASSGSQREDARPQPFSARALHLLPQGLGAPQPPSLPPRSPAALTATSRTFPCFGTCPPVGQGRRASSTGGNTWTTVGHHTWQAQCLGHGEQARRAPPGLHLCPRPWLLQPQLAA